MLTRLPSGPNGRGFIERSQRSVRNIPDRPLSYLSKDCSGDCRRSGPGNAPHGTHLLPDLGIGSNLDPVRIERTTSDDFSGVSFAGAWPFGERLLLASRFCNLLDDHRWAIGKPGDEVELSTHRFDIALEG